MCALDFTAVDEEGNPWDFNLPSQRAKAMKLEVERPLRLITCSMCVWAAQQLQLLETEKVW